MPKSLALSETPDQPCARGFCQPAAGTCAAGAPRPRIFRRTLAAGALLILLLWTDRLPASTVEGAAPSPDADTLRIIEMIMARENSLGTFSARFEQIQKSRLFDHVVHSEGIIHYDARGKLLFRVTSPAPLAIVFDGGWLVIHDPEQGRTQRRHLGHRDNLLKRYFGLGQSTAELLRRFEVQASPNAPLPGVTLRMIPRADRLSKHVELISAEVDDKSWLPREIFIQRSETEWSRIHLEFTSIDQPLPADAFDIPEDSVRPPAAAKETP